jgi:hypothetical protein
LTRRAFFACLMALLAGLRPTTIYPHRIGARKRHAIKAVVGQVDF